jgi:hypothetical protein
MYQIILSDAFSEIYRSLLIHHSLHLKHVTSHFEEHKLINFYAFIYGSDNNSGGEKLILTSYSKIALLGLKEYHGAYR